MAASQGCLPDLKVIIDLGVGGKANKGLLDGLINKTGLFCPFICTDVGHLRYRDCNHAICWMYRQ